MRLSGKKILLTGANGGIGRAIAEKALAEGAHLALCDKTSELAKSAKAALPDNTNRARMTDQERSIGKLHVRITAAESRSSYEACPESLWRRKKESGPVGRFRCKRTRG